MVDRILGSFVPSTQAAAVRCELTKWEQGGVCSFTGGHVLYLYTKWFTCYPSGRAPYEQKHTTCGWAG